MTKTNTKTTEPLFCRTIANALERHLEKSNSTVHWAQPAGDETSWGPPKLVWPEDPDLGFLVQRGNSEGMKVLVFNQLERYDSSKQQPLLVIKFLCGTKQAFTEAAEVMDFIERMDIQALLATQTK